MSHVRRVNTGKGSWITILWSVRANQETVLGRTLVVSFSLDYDHRHQQTLVLVTRDGQLWVITGKVSHVNKRKHISLLGYPSKFNQIWGLQI